MVNFRFHLVSLTAVFLALAAGITIGAGVVDRATVDQIERQLADVARNREATNAENDQLRADLAQWGRFSEQAGDQLVAGTLTDAAVVIVATTGVDRDLVEGFAGGLTSAGATVDATFWFTGQWALEDQERGRQLAGILDVAPTTGAEALRDAGIAAVSSAWEAGDGGPLVDALTEAGFLEVVRPAPAADAEAEVVAPAQLPRPDSLFVVVSGDDADVPATALALPLAVRLAAGGRPVLAAQPQRPPAPEGAEVDDEEEVVPEFVAAVRAATPTGQLSSIDNLQDYRGRISAVLALRDLRLGRTGHYGFGPDTRLVPEPPAG